MSFYDRKLCYVEGQSAFFTDNFENQWGDDWNDAPYEHNAGWPYCLIEGREDPSPNDGNITRVFFDGPFYPPRRGHLNSSYTVEQINGGGDHAPPWLAAEPYVDNRMDIYAGATLTEFIRIVREAGGSVFLDMDDLGILGCKTL